MQPQVDAIVGLPLDSLDQLEVIDRQQGPRVAAAAAIHGLVRENA